MNVIINGTEYNVADLKPAYENGEITEAELVLANKLFATEFAADLKRAYEKGEGKNLTGAILRASDLRPEDLLTKHL